MKKQTQGNKVAVCTGAERIQQYSASRRTVRLSAWRREAQGKPLRSDDKAALMSGHPPKK